MFKLILYTAVALIFYGCGEYYSKVFANNSKISYGVIATLCYVVTCVLWLPVLRINNSLSVMTTLWTVFYVLIAVVVGVFLFQESLSMFNVVGIVLAVVACVFLCL
jgi:multidrug transporter EmrE-like cation transporter